MNISYFLIKAWCEQCVTMSMLDSSERYCDPPYLSVTCLTNPW